MAQLDANFERRPDPDALLALSNPDGRGTLRIFLGASPGVGKTYSMLARAQAAKKDHINIVVGLVETHGRQETLELLEGLEVLPRRKCEYKGRVIEEFDIDAALARKPELIIVDELAHTNAPDSRHPKRWQDVEELLSAGINVWTALNIQHVESLADVVSRITGITIRETVPDKVLHDATDVILVDVPIEELLQRLKDGKIYFQETAKRATQNFFTPRNLTALRELALRRTAASVDDQMVDMLRQGAIEGPWGSSERLLVCVGNRTSEELVRAAARLATGLNATWLAVYVDSDEHESQSIESMKTVDSALRLAMRLGAKIERLSGDDLVGELLRLARHENITQIIIGRSKQGQLAQFFRRSLTHEIIRRSRDVAIHVIVKEIEEPKSRWSQWRHLKPSEAIKNILYILASLLPTVAVGFLIEHWLKIRDISVIFFVPVIFCATNRGLWTAVAAAFISFLSYDFFFTEPRFEFTIHDPEVYLDLLMSLFVAIVTGVLTSRMQMRSQLNIKRAKTAQLLLQYSRKLSESLTINDILAIAAEQIQKASEASCAVLLVEDRDNLKIASASPAIDNLDEREMAAARWAFEGDEFSGWQTNTLPNVRFQFRPLTTTRGVVAVCGIEPKKKEDPFSPQVEGVLEILIEQAAIAIERLMLLGELSQSR